MKQIAKSMLISIVLSLMLAVTCQASVKKVTITSPVQKGTYTVYRTEKNVTKVIKANVAVTSQKDKKTLKYSSSNPEVVSIDSKGRFICKKAGTAKITAASKQTPSKKDTLKVKVVQRAVKLAAKTSTGYAVKNSITIAKGKSVNIKIIAIPSDAGNKVSWKSSNIKIAKVSSKGKITAVKTGTAKITAAAKDGSKKKVSFKVKVTAGRVTGITLNKKTITLVKGKSADVKASVRTTGIGANKTVVWSSSKAGVATVSNGRIKAVKKGSAIITAQSIDGTNKKASVSVKVINKPGDNPTTKPGDNPTTKPGEKQTTKPGEKQTTKPGEKQTTKPGEKPTTKPGEKQTTKPGEKQTTKPGENPTTKPGENPTTKPGEEQTTETEKEETVVKIITINTDKVTNGIEFKGTNSLEWDDPDKAITAANNLKKDIEDAVKMLLGNLVKPDTKHNDVKIVANGSTYKMVFENDEWKLYNSAGKEESIKDKLFGTEITDMKIERQLSEEDVKRNLKLMFVGKKLIDGTYDFGKGKVNMSGKKYNITNCIIKKSKLNLTVDGDDITVEMTGGNQITAKGGKSLNGFITSIKNMLGDAITIKS